MNTELTTISKRVAEVFGITVDEIKLAKTEEQRQARETLIELMSTHGCTYEQIRQEINVSSIKFQKRQHYERMRKDSLYREKNTILMKEFPPAAKKIYGFRINISELNECKEKAGNKNLTNIIINLLRGWRNGEYDPSLFHNPASHATIEGTREGRPYTR